MTFCYNEVIIWWICIQLLRLIDGLSADEELRESWQVVTPKCWQPNLRFIKRKKKQRNENVVLRNLAVYKSSTCCFSTSFKVYVVMHTDVGPNSQFHELYKQQNCSFCSTLLINCRNINSFTCREIEKRRKQQANLGKQKRVESLKYFWAPLS